MVLAGEQQAQGQTQTETGFLNRTVELKGLTFKYQVYIPADYNASQRWPVILFLHGAGERGTDGLVQTQIGLAPSIRGNAKRWPAIAIFPQVPPDSMWNGVPAEAAMLALERTMKDYVTDPDRVYLTGLSMGGNGSFYLAYRYAEKFAAVVPICGWVTPFSETLASGGCRCAGRRNNGLRAACTEVGENPGLDLPWRGRPCGPGGAVA